MKMTMNRRFVYGGMATAMVVVLAAGASLNYMSSYSIQSDKETAGETSLINTPAKQTLLLSRQEEQTAGTAGKKDDLRARELSQGRRSDDADHAQTQLADNNRVNAKNEYQFAAKERSLAETGARMEMDSISGGSIAMVPPASAPAEKKVARQALLTESIMTLNSSVTVSDEIAPKFYKDVGRDTFEDFEENPIKLVSEEPVSTFSVDVDTASYSFMRRQINAGVLPQKDSVRIEEMINYFDYDYKQPESKEVPFKHNVLVTPSPWKDGNKLIHIGIKGYDIQETPRSNLVFLLDVSGSMNSPDKLPLLVNSMKLLLDTLSPEDTVGIVVYAGAAGTVLEPTKVADKAKILQALDNLSAGGSTAGAEGIRQAYQLAESNFDKQAVNRVILATDGDFNVGITNREELKDFIERKRESGIFLSVLGFGQGNYNDHLMQELAQNGNGVAAYIDNLNEARKVLVDEATSTLFPIAKDVKIQVEFNPATVAEYRLIGYETRHLNREDFNNDAVDAGDIGAGHTVTAIYEITPVGGPRTVDDSRYAEKAAQTEAHTRFSHEYAFLKMRYKLPGENTSKLITTPITRADQAGVIPEDQDCSYAPDCDPYNFIPEDALFATAVAGFGQLLRGGKYTGSFTYDDAIELALHGKGEDEFGYRAEFINLVRLAKSAAALQDTQPR